MDDSSSKKGKLDQAASFALGFEVPVDAMEASLKRLEESGEMDNLRECLRLARIGEDTQDWDLFRQLRGRGNRDA